MSLLDSMTPVDANWIMLAHFYKTPTIASRAFEHLEPQHFVNHKVKGTIGQALIYGILKAIIQSGNSSPDEALLSATLNGLKQNYGQQEQDSISQDYIVFLETKLKIDKSSEHAALSRLQVILDEVVFIPAQRDALINGSDKFVSGIGSRLIDLEAKRLSASGTKSKTGLLSTKLATGKRVLTHIPWIDKRFGSGGGIVNGSGIALIAPTGVGKTTFGIQLAIAQALVEKHSLLVLSEEGFSSSIQERIISAVTGISRKHQQAADGDLKKACELAGKNWDYVQFATELANKYLHVYDMTEPGCMSLESLHAELFAMNDKTKLAYSYIDWAGPIANHMMSAGYRGRKYGDKVEPALKDLAYLVADWAAKTDSNIMISHQMGTAEVKMGPYATQTAYCARDCKGFAEPMKIMMVINPRTTDNHFRASLMQVVKCRDDEPVDRFVVQLNGENGTFEDVSEKVEMRGNTNKFRPKGGFTNQTPEEA